MAKGTRQQQDSAKVRHIAKKPHARGHCELCATSQSCTTQPAAS